MKCSFIFFKYRLKCYVWEAEKVQYICLHKHLRITIYDTSSSAKLPKIKYDKDETLINSLKTKTPTDWENKTKMVEQIFL